MIFHGVSWSGPWRDPRVSESAGPGLAGPGRESELVIVACPECRVID